MSIKISTHLWDEREKSKLKTCTVHVVMSNICWELQVEEGFAELLPWINIPSYWSSLWGHWKQPLVPSIQTVPQPESIFYSSQGSRVVLESMCLQLPFSLDNMERIKYIFFFKLECDLTNSDSLISTTEMQRHHTHFSNNVTGVHITYKWLIHSQLLIYSPVWKALDWKLTSALVPHSLQ